MEAIINEKNFIHFCFKPVQVIIQQIMHGVAKIKDIIQEVIKNVLLSCEKKRTLRREYIAKSKK